LAFLKKITFVPLSNIILNIDFRVDTMTFGIEVERLGAKGFDAKLWARLDYSVVPIRGIDWRREA
jgi:hypothetical protein